MITAPRLEPRVLRSALMALAILVALAGAATAVPTPARAAADYQVFATAGTTVELRTRPSEERKIVTTLAPGTTLELLEGPNEAGWYRVSAPYLPEARPGWVPGELLRFDRFVRATWDITLFAGPSEGTAVLGWVRHGIVLTIVGPGEGDFLLIRYGDIMGYAPVPALAPDPGPATDPSAERWVDVNRSTGEVRLMIGETVVDTFRASLSRDQGEGFYATATGTYAVYEKIAGLTYTPYANAYFMYWVGFDPARFNGFHSWTMDARGNVLAGGWGPTAGCVATAPAEAAIIYDFVDIGTRVEIHW